jgi:hypothetical protein
MVTAFRLFYLVATFGILVNDLLARHLRELEERHERERERIRQEANRRLGDPRPAPGFPEFREFPEWEPEVRDLPATGRDWEAIA